MKKVFAIGASNSSKSINTLFTTYVANQIENKHVIPICCDDLVLPLYSSDLELSEGISENAKHLENLFNRSMLFALIGNKQPMGNANLTSGSYGVQMELNIEIHAD